MAVLAVVTSSPPGADGGHMSIARALVTAANESGHTAHLVVTPDYGFGRQTASYWAAWRTNVQEIGGSKTDQVITFRHPSYAVRHYAHVCWLNHTMREYYDLWERFVRGLGRRGRLKEGVRRKIFHTLDRWLLTNNVKRLIAQSRTIQGRLQRFGAIASDLLYPPPPERPYRTDAYGDYVFAVSRLHPLKRLDLLVEAAALARDRSLSFKIAGEGEEEPRLRERIRALGLEGRVELLGGVTDAQLVDHYARCRAVYFAPWNEDYGFVTLEAFRSAKGVITASDSGGPAELVRHGENGLVAAPTAAGVAAQLDALGGDRGLAERLGQTARRDAAAHRWDRAVEELMKDV